MIFGFWFLIFDFFFFLCLLGAWGFGVWPRLGEMRAGNIVKGGRGRGHGRRVLLVFISHVNGYDVTIFSGAPSDGA